MDLADVVWITICYDVVFEEKVDGGWTWKHKGNGRASLMPLLVSKIISYAELYEKVRGALGIDTRLQKMEFAALVPGMSNVPIPPMKIDCDNNVLWYISVCKEVPLCVTILRKDVLEYDENWRDQDANSSAHDDGFLMRSDDVVENAERDVVHNQENDSYENREANYLRWDDLNIVAQSPEREEVAEPSIGPHVKDVPMNDICLQEPHIPMDIHNLSVDLVPTQAGSSVRIPENEDVQVKQIFSSKKSLISKLQLLSMRCHFEFKVKKSNRSLYSVVCIDEKCTWKLRATKMKGSDMFEILKYIGLHICSMSVRRKYHKHATYSIIGSHITSKFEDPNRVYTPKNIINDIHDEFGITISYTKAYMAKDFAVSRVRGTPDDSYASLPSYCYALEQKNPGTLTFIETGDDQRFKYFFMALGPSIRGFQTSIRRVISVDGTFLTNRYKDTLLIATCQDANVQIYPLAWAVVDSENEASWTWFFRKLKAITSDVDELIIISDRGKSIPVAFQNVYHFAHHVHCIWHLQNNLKKKFSRIDFGTLFWMTAEAYNMTDFDKKMTALCGLHEGIRHYLEHEVGGVHVWSRAHCKGIRYNIMTTNNAESLNSALKNPRDFPILGLIEHIRVTLQKWFYERHDDTKKCSSYLTPSMEKKMCMMYNMSHGMKVIPISPTEFEVCKELDTQIVNLETLTCTCKQFDLEKFPCAHVIAAVKYDGGDGYKLCSTFYTTFCWRKSYSEFVYPLPVQDEWQIPDHIRSNIVLCPSSKRPSGRPPKQRKKSFRELLKPRKCSRCLKTGHYRATCNNPLA